MYHQNVSPDEAASRKYLLLRRYPTANFELRSLTNRYDMAIDENGVHSANRLKVGDTTVISKDMFPEEPIVGNHYTSPTDSDHWILIPNDGLKDKPCVIRVEEVKEDSCICVVTELHRKEI